MATKQKILIVDDDENIAELISLYLTKECFETKIVYDGESALLQLDTFRPNLILLDLNWGLMIILSSRLKQRSWLPASRQFYAATKCRRNPRRSVQLCSAWNTRI